MKRNYIAIKEETDNGIMTTMMPTHKAYGSVTWVDDQGHKGECSLQEMIDANHDMESGDPTVDCDEMDKLRNSKVGQTVRLNGYSGMWFDVTRVA